MAAVALGFSSCEQDRDPVLQKPTTFVLNSPEMADQYINLTPGEVLELSCTQPDYGYSAVAQYSAEMSLTEDFADSRALESKNATQARLQLDQAAIAVALCELNGFDSEDNYQDLGPQKVYFRAVCELSGVADTRIVSNVVAYNHIKGYFAIPTPGFIYLVGAPEGWAGPTESNADHYAGWRLYEPSSAIGSKVYSGVFDIPAGSAMFRFYTALTGWDADSYGSQADDNPIDYEIVDGSFSGTIVKGKGAFNFPDWAGGEMTITVDMSDPGNMILTIQEGSHSVTVSNYIYLVGAPSGWIAPGIENEEAYKAFRLADNSESGIFTGSFACAAGHLNFRFATELNDKGWDSTAQIGTQATDGDVACEFDGNNTFTGPYMPGKGNWAFELDADATISMTVDTNNSSVVFVKQ